MRINIFNLKQRHDDWKEVKHALHQVWIGNSDVNLPMFCDVDFQKTYSNLRKLKSLQECKDALGL